MFSGINNPQMGEVQTLKALVHRFGYFRGFAEFAFNSVPAAVMDEKKVNLSVAMGGPENAWGGLMICKICSMAKPSHDAPTRG